MRFFKHLSTAHEDNALEALLEEMGTRGYGIYWLLLEHFAAAMPRDCERVPEIVRSVLAWADLCRVSTRTFKKFVERASKLKLIESNWQANLKQFESRMPAERLQICIPKLLKYRDEHLKKRPFSPHKSPQKGAVDIELDIDNSKSTLCIDNIQSQEQTRAREAESPHTPPHPPNGNGNSHPNGARKPVLATLPDWEKICIAARKGGMSYDPSPQSVASRRFRLLTLPERIAAIEGIQKRIACGEYDPSQPAFTHTLENYLTRKIWQQAVRPQIRGPAKRKVVSALERLAAKGASAND